jgi:hypothetical protein
MSRLGTARAWKGYWHVNVGVHAQDGIQRNWSDPRRYGFLSAGQGPEWRDKISVLQPGDKVFAYLNRSGYVGAGIVTSSAVPAAAFVPPGRDTPLSALPLVSRGWFTNSNDIENAEYVIGMKWISTRDAREGIRGRFLRGTVCRILDPQYAAALEKAFGLSNK